MTVTLQIHICAQRRSYRATFTTQEQAVDFINRRYSTHAVSELEDCPVPGDWKALLEALYPTCEHNMSQSSCYGPDHFMSAAQEQAMGWDYSDAPPGF